MVEARSVRLTLVSASPRRAELLKQLGVQFDVVPSAASERWLAANGMKLAMMNARRKIERSPYLGDRSRLLLGADTLIETSDGLLGKPAGPESASRMLQRLSGRAHRVITGVCLAGPAAELSVTSPLIVSSVAVTQVHFRTLAARTLRGYIRSREWDGKAGAYAIQGRAGDFVARLEGEFDNVVGLPLRLVRDLLREKFVHCRLC